MKDSSVNGHNYTVIVAVPIIHQFKVSNRVSMGYRNSSIEAMGLKHSQRYVPPVFG